MDGKSALGVRTAVVEGSLAPQMRRAAAARANACGLQIMNLPQLASRLAGGFTASITAEYWDPAIQRALDDGGFVELESVYRSSSASPSGQAEDGRSGGAWRHRPSRA